MGEYTPVRTEPLRERTSNFASLIGQRALHLLPRRRTPQERAERRRVRLQKRKDQADSRVAEKYRKKGPAGFVVAPSPCISDRELYEASKAYKERIDAGRGK